MIEMLEFVVRDWSKEESAFSLNDNGEVLEFERPKQILEQGFGCYKNIGIWIKKRRTFCALYTDYKSVYFTIGDLKIDCSLPNVKIKQKFIFPYIRQLIIMMNSKPVTSFFYYRYEFYEFPEEDFFDYVVRITATQNEFEKFIQYYKLLKKCGGSKNDEFFKELELWSNEMGRNHL